MSKYPGRVVTDLAPAGYSVYFDGTGDYLSTPTGQTNLTLATSDFTVEGFFYPLTQVQTNPALFTSTPGSSLANALLVQINTSNNTLELWINGVNLASSSTNNAIRLNSWNHIAVCRTGGSTYSFYINGVAVNNVATNSASLTTNSWLISFWYLTAHYFTGYASNFRIVKGTALYSGATINVPTQLLNVTNTQLLTCNSPAIIDQSNNAFAITVNGNSAVSTFTPFTAYVPYNPALGASTPGVWTLDEAMQAKATRQWNMYDPNFNQTVLLLHGNGANNAQNNTFLDSGTANSGSGFTITRSGNTTQGSFSPFSQTGWGLRTSDRSYITIPASSDFDLINTDFTVEFWINFNAFNTMSSSGSNLFGNALSTATNGWSMGFAGSGKTVTSIEYRVFAASVQSANNFTGLSLQFGTWYHIVLQRNGSGSGNLRLFVNGVQQGAAQTANTYSSAGSTFTLGSGSYTQNGTYSGNADYYLSNVRLTKSAVYSISGFSSPTSPLTQITNTTLLICQSNRLVNNGTNTGIITSSAWAGVFVVVTPFGPFYPTIAYTPATIGGGGYFDGTGDYLTVANNAAFNFGSGNFCIETWFYPTLNSQTTKALITLGSVATGAGAWLLWLNTSAFPAFYVTTGGTTATRTDLADNKIPPANSWTHIVVCRTGNTLSLFVNGSRVASTAYSSTVFNDTTDPLTFMVPSDGGAVTAGYLSGSRIIKGSSPYDATLTSLTVPTAPATNINNTSILLNFTNASIFDNTAKNVFETVADAKISTVQSKFGGSSMLFDGSGDYLISSSVPVIRTSPFTIECWVYKTTSNFDTIVSWGGSSGNFRFFTASATSLAIWNGASQILVATGVPSLLNRWAHIVAQRNSSDVLQIFVDGVSYGTLTTTSDFNTGTFYVGGEGAANPFTGYINELRYTFGVARYVTNFTPQTSQWQNE